MRLVYQDIREVAAFVTAYALSLLVKLWHDLTFVQTLSSFLTTVTLCPFLVSILFFVLSFQTFARKHVNRRHRSVSTSTNLKHKSCNNWVLDFFAELLVSNARICHICYTAPFDFEPLELHRRTVRSQVATSPDIMRVYLLATAVVIAVRAAGSPAEHNILSALAPHMPTPHTSASTASHVQPPVASSISDGLESVMEQFAQLSQLMLISNVDFVKHQSSHLEQSLQPRMWM